MLWLKVALNTAQKKAPTHPTLAFQASDWPGCLGGISPTGVVMAGEYGGIGDFNMPH